LFRGIFRSKVILHLVESFASWLRKTLKALITSNAGRFIDTLTELELADNNVELAQLEQLLKWHTRSRVATHKDTKDLGVVVVTVAKFLG
jgi:hypothetical protein